MADTATVEPIYLIVSSVQKKFTTIVGPYFDAALTPPVMPCVSHDIWERAKCSKTRRNDLIAQIHNAIPTLKPNEREMFVETLPDDPRPLVGIREIFGISSDFTKTIKDLIQQSTTRPVVLYLVFVRFPRSGKVVKWRRSLADTLQYYAREYDAFGTELDFDFDSSVHTYGDYSAAEAHAQDLMNRASTVNGENCVSVPCNVENPNPLRLDDTLVGATYNKQSSQLWELFFVKKVLVTMEGRQYVQITEEDKRVA